MSSRFAVVGSLPGEPQRRIAVRKLEEHEERDEDDHVDDQDRPDQPSHDVERHSEVACKRPPEQRDDDHEPDPPPHVAPGEEPDHAHAEEDDGDREEHEPDSSEIQADARSGVGGHRLLQNRPPGRPWAPRRCKRSFVFRAYFTEIMAYAGVVLNWSNW